MCRIIRDLNPSKDKSYTSPKIQTVSKLLTVWYSVGSSLCLEMNRVGRGCAVNHSTVTSFQFKQKIRTSTPHIPSLPVQVILYFLTLSSLTVSIPVVLFVTICVTDSVRL